uniref:Uncharacterized protein n=1 Tax=Panagrolaimus sp. JU765 TaxID=591449 RepID=A0AC34PV75_9BILA
MPGVVQEYRRGRTCFSQDFQLDIVRNKLINKFDVYLVVISSYNGKFSHIKLNKKKLIHPEALELATSVAAVLESKFLDIDYNYGLPFGHTIPLSRDLISLIRLPNHVLEKPEHYLKPGDEIFVQCRTMNISFFHSGIYAGNE